MTFEVAKIRAQFPILGTKVNGVPLHYLDNAATSQIPEAVLDTLRAHETQSRANVLRGVHHLAEAATEAYEQARIAVAAYLNAGSPNEVIFTSGATAAINLVAHAFGQRFEEGDEVVISLLEHHSNIVPWQLLRERTRIVLKALPVTAEGRLDLDKLGEVVGPRCRLIALTHASNATGAVTDVGPIVEAARAVGAKVLLDGAQRAPHGPLDVQALGIDFYAFSSHKMFAPNGVGVLWGRSEVLDDLPPFLGGGEMIRSVTIGHTTYADVPHRFEAGTPPIAQAVGLGAAVRWIRKLDGAAVEAHLARLTERILDGLTTLDRGHGVVRVIGPQGLQGRLPVISFDITGAHPHDVCQILDSHGVALRGGHHCAQPLMEVFDLSGTSRASLAPYNDDGDIDAFLAGLDEAITRLT